MLSQDLVPSLKCCAYSNSGAVAVIEWPGPAAVRLSGCALGSKDRVTRDERNVTRV